MSVYATSLCRLGNMLYQQSQYSEALELYDRSLDINPAYPAALNNRGVTLLAMGEPMKAMNSFESAVSLEPTFAEALYNRGNTRRQLRRFAEALIDYESAISARPEYAEAHNNRGNMLQELRRPLEALECYDRALQLNPSYTEALENKAVLLMEFGRMESARQALEAVLSVEPRRARAHFHLARIKPMRRGDPRLQVLETLEREHEALGGNYSADINFALAKANDDIGEYERAFAHFAKGNALMRAKTDYNEASTLAHMRRIGAAFTKEKIESRRGWGDGAAAPIFIFGMPRTGSTLIEQILSRHPKVASWGETDAFHLAAAGVRDPAGRSLLPPEFSSSLSAPQLQGIARRYLQELSSAEPVVKQTTDKSPGNFLHAGLIHLAMPNARLIHTRRDPLDTCWSCYSQRFTESGGPQFSYDLAELGRYYSGYRALMRHWQETLPEGAILTVDYEDVVADVEGQARRIFAHCGLEWNEDGLTFYEADRHVRTASAGQVNRPIYTSAIGRSRHYEKQLAALASELASSSNAPTP